MYVVFFERNLSWLYVCNIPFHTNETSQQKNIIILKKWRVSFQNKCHAKNPEGVWTLLKGVFPLSTYCMFLQEYCFLLEGRPYLQSNCFEEVKSFLKNGHTRNTLGRLSFIKGCIAFFHILYGSAGILLLTWGNIIKADCNLYAARSFNNHIFPGMKQVASTIALFDSNTEY